MQAEVVFGAFYRNKELRTLPQHNTTGTPCNIVKDCISGLPALYIVGKMYACAKHKDVAFTMQRGQRRNMTLPEVAEFEPEFEPEFETLDEADEVEVERYARIAQQED